jgi:hypothetical protein
MRKHRATICPATWVFSSDRGLEERPAATVHPFGRGFLTVVCWLDTVDFEPIGPTVTGKLCP